MPFPETLAAVAGLVTRTSRFLGDPLVVEASRGAICAKAIAGEARSAMAQADVRKREKRLIIYIWRRWRSRLGLRNLYARRISLLRGGWVKLIPDSLLREVWNGK